MATTQIPQWIFSCLDQYANCACGIRIVKKMGKEGLIKALEAKGYPCELEIIADPKDTSEFPEDGTYILTLKSTGRKNKSTEDDK
ncbi:hypothetical protein IM774_11315 [Erysipelotrichaceae bacterium RD49]|nr:hypothetical protein [Erysipelotrichaceae bacterium RD49]